MRQLIGQQFEGETYGEDWLVVDAMGAERRSTMSSSFATTGDRSAHACAGRPRALEVDDPAAAKPARRWSATRRSRACSRPGAAPRDGIERKAVYRFHARTAEAFSNGRIFLAGDAAHITPPFAGQGLVAGLRDAANLSWKIAWVLQGALAKILDSYDEERRPHAKAMIDLAKFMGRLIMPHSAAKALLIHGLCAFAAHRPRCAAISTISGSSPRTRFRGLFAPGRSGSKLTRGGPFPQGWVRDPRGRIALATTPWARR